MAALLGGLASLGSAAGRQQATGLSGFSLKTFHFSSKKLIQLPWMRSETSSRKNQKVQLLLEGAPFGTTMTWMMTENFILLPVRTFSATVVRFASKKSGGSTKNRGGNRTGKRYGFKKLDGQFVHAGNILATQRVIRWHPGAHVGMGYNKWLYALEDGIVRFTKEIYVPPARGKESREVICQLPKGAVLYKTFINVIPTEEVGSFKLITMI